MRWFASIFVSVLALALMPVQAAELSELPASLAQWYKPANKRQVWLHTMFALRRELQAVGHYVQAGDAERAKSWGQRLLEHYRKLGEMVPEWQQDLDLDEASTLEQALAEARLEDARAASNRLARSCRSCHREYRALAAARFRSPDFSAMSFEGVDGQQRTHAEQMNLLSRITNGVKIALEDGLWDEASSQLDQLRQGLGALSKGCDQCHADAPPKERILGADSQAQLDKLATALKAEDSKTADASLGELAVNVCARCHGVHRTLYDLRQQLFP
jgi:cytochrome c2